MKQHVTKSRDEVNSTIVPNHCLENVNSMQAQMLELTEKNINGQLDNTEESISKDTVIEYKH